MLLFLPKSCFSYDAFFGSYDYEFPDRVVNHPVCYETMCKFKYPCPDPYTCSAINLTFKRGTYILEATGGGSNLGYSYGIVSFPKTTNILLHIGGSFFEQKTIKTPIYNGGGMGCDYSGGGATDFRTSQDIHDRFIIAGGGPNGGGESNANFEELYGQNSDVHNCPSLYPRDPDYEENMRRRKGGGGGLYGGINNQGGSGFVYNFSYGANPAIINKINHFKVLSGDTFFGHPYNDGYQAKIRLADAHYYIPGINNMITPGPGIHYRVYRDR
ncbi:hypothetical protein TVAG_014030 [Trichomonas vaginalis G3]|uniref:Loricrin n=2 Tax=Trichomonas vaginalis (strain ATCC PRA-98 / G3) TaxID=412133 RepID=A2DDF7_TRIV3|nr:hypothetical protein TVAG_014030 [Trichomonas vaginalis G3]|eukprot:XP_001582622.1 hypothetical protein [Trichomonas vaginalis G3]